MLTLLLALLVHAQDDAAFQVLHSPNASASTYLVSNWNKYTENYHPIYVLDGDPTTAWVEGATGQGEGSWLELPVSRVSAVHRVRLQVRNGYHKTSKLLAANAAAADVRVELWLGERVVASQDASLKRDLTWQTIDLDPAQDVTFDAVRLVVVSAHKGGVYADLCISDVQVLVDAGSEYNGPIEKAKHQAAMHWMASRQEMAAYFASQPKAYPFAATQFRSEIRDATEPERLGWMSRNEALRGQMTALLHRGPWMRAEVQGSVKLPDGLELQGLDRWLGGDVSVFEAKGEYRYKGAGRTGWVQEEAESNAKVELAADGRTPVRLALHTRQVVEERGTWIEDVRWLVSFNEAGRPVQIFAARVDNGDEVCGQWHSDELLNLTWADGKVQRVEQERSRTCTGEVRIEGEEQYTRPAGWVRTWTPAS